MARTKIEYAGDFEILTCTIHTSEGNTIPLKEELVYIDIFEDIDNAAISGELAIVDTMGNIQQTAPLIGQELLELHIGIPGLGGEWDYRQSLMHITSFVSRQDENKGQLLTMRFISREFVDNTRINISQSFTGSSSDIVSQIMRNIIKTNKDLYIEPSSDVKKIVSPDISPFDLIALCKREAISKSYNSATYHFYENKEGYNFRSLESMYSQATMQDYTLYVGNLIDCGNEEIEKQFSQLLNYEIEYSDDTSMNQQVGQYGSRTIVHDIYNKRYDTSIYNYHESFEDEKHMNSFAGKSENPIYNSVGVDFDNNKISDFPIKTYLMPVSRKYPYKNTDGSHQQAGLYNFSTGRPESRMGQRTSRMMQIKNGRDVTVTVHGNTLVSAGDMVELNIPFKTGAVQIDNRTVDRFANGPHLVKRIRHSFRNGEKPMYFMYMTCAKDCIDEELRDEGIPDQGQSKQPLIISDFYGEDELH